MVGKNLEGNKDNVERAEKAKPFIEILTETKILCAHKNRNRSYFRKGM